MKSIDEAIHTFYETYDSEYGIKWNDFNAVGIEEYYYDYYYAENGIYVIRNRIDHSCYFIKANSPQQAHDALNNLTYIGTSDGENYE